MLIGGNLLVLIVGMTVDGMLITLSRAGTRLACSAVRAGGRDDDRHRGRKRPAEPADRGQAPA